jgi:hypothetical protein
VRNNKAPAAADALSINKLFSPFLCYDRNGAGHSAVNDMVLYIRIAHIRKELFVRFQNKLPLEIRAEQRDEFGIDIDIHKRNLPPLIFFQLHIPAGIPVKSPLRTKNEITRFRWP